MREVTLLIPVYNEEESLRALFGRLEKIKRKISQYSLVYLFVDDGSSDHTLEIIKKQAKKHSHVHFLRLSRNFGKEVAMIAGLDHTKSDAVIILDADLQDPPELIPQMIEVWEEGYDDVYAKRRTRAGESTLKRKTSEWFYRLLRRSTEIPIQIDTGDFRLLDRRCIDALKKIRESERYTKGMFSWIGYRKKEILYDREPRSAGTTKWNYYKLLNLAVDGITSFTTAPLRFATLLGLLVSLFAFIYIIVIILQTLIFGNPIGGYPSLISVVLFLGGIQLLSLGIIGEYIGKIFIETKQRPLYFIEDDDGYVDTENKA